MDSDELSNLILILFGICIWDFVTSLWFEYRLLTKKLRFRWQFVPYFLARYFVLVYSTMNVSKLFFNFPSLPICTRAAFFTSTIFLGILTLVFSTWNLLTRTIIIWGHHPLVMRSLFAIGFVHFLLAIFTATIGRLSCTPIPPGTVMVSIFSISTATLELAILTLSVVGVRRASMHRETALGQLLIAQGAVYFVTVFVLQMIMIITKFVSHDGVTNPCVAIFGSVLSPILSCRLVTSTLSQTPHTDGHSELQPHHIERFELSEDRNQTSTQMTTHIEITKDRSVC